MDTWNLQVTLYKYVRTYFKYGRINGFHVWTSARARYYLGPSLNWSGHIIPRFRKEEF